MGLSGASSAASVRTGLALGRGDPRRAALAVAVALSFACALGAANALVLYLCRDPLPALFANDRAIRTAAAAAMPALACYQVFDAWNAVTGGVMRGAGKQEQPALIMLAAYYVFGIPAAVLCAFVFRLRLVGLWSGLTRRARVPCLATPPRCVRPTRTAAAASASSSPPPSSPSPSPASTGDIWPSKPSSAPTPRAPTPSPKSPRTTATASRPPPAPDSASPDTQRTSARTTTLTTLLPADLGFGTMFPALARHAYPRLPATVLL